jgi:hypothetical protein
MSKYIYTPSSERQRFILNSHFACPKLTCVATRIRKLLATRLEKESKLVKDESLKVLQEFEMIDYES